MRRVSAWASPAVLAFLAISLLTFACKTEKKSSQKSNLSSVVRPPIPALDPMFHEFIFDAENGGDFQLTNGTSIHLPANALTDGSGRSISGKALLKYREMHNASSVYLSGIPLQFKDAKGNPQTLQTAGMFDIRAEQDGNALLLASGKQIDVHMASYQIENDYDKWILNEKTGLWTNLGKSDTEINVSKKLKKKELEKLNAGLPFPLDQNYFAFSYASLLDITYEKNRSAIPSKSSILAKAKAYGLEYSNISTWDYITYKGRETATSLLVWKNLSGKPIPKGHQYLLAELLQLSGDKYLMNIKNEKNKSVFSGKVEIAMTLQSLYKFPPEHWIAHYEQAKASIDSSNAYYELMADVFRDFSIREFGIYNFDRCMQKDGSVEMSASFKFDEPVNIEDKDFEVVYVGSDKRTIIKFPSTSWKIFTIMPDNKARLFALLPGNKVALFSEKDFASVDFNSIKSMSQPTHEFHLHTLPEEVKSPADLNRLVGI